MTDVTDISDIFSFSDAAALSMDLPRGAHIHFIGIGGSSMSGLALLALHAGYRVSGSDRANSNVLLMLSSKGAEIHIGQSPDNITSDIALVVYTVAISPDDPELAAAYAAGIPVLERAKYLGVLSRQYRFPIAISGTHGKTTTTAMIGAILLAAGKDPSIHLGGNFPLIGGSVRPSFSDYFVTEACEYHAHMLELSPYGAVLLNVEAEHLDYYKDLNDIKAAFTRFVQLCPPEGFAVACKEDGDAAEVLANAACRKITYALKASGLHADYEADCIVESSEGISFQWYCSADAKDTSGHAAKLSVPGRHNVLNALAAISVCHLLGCSPEDIRKGLALFTGTGRRFEKVGSVRGATLIDDYAHHPTEIEATLAAARATISDSGRVLAIFQAHTYSRALAFKSDFAAALAKADQIFVADIYAAREPDPGTVSGASMAADFQAAGLNAHYYPDFQKIANAVSSVLKPGDLVISLGAGDVNKVLGMIQ